MTSDVAQRNDPKTPPLISSSGGESGVAPGVQRDVPGKQAKSKRGMRSIQRSQLFDGEN
jgi:hypothetical protein